jgi:hypothetical protein
MDIAVAYHKRMHEVVLEERPFELAIIVEMGSRIMGQVQARFQTVGGRCEVFGICMIEQLKAN